MICINRFLVSFSRSIHMFSWSSNRGLRRLLTISRWLGVSPVIQRKHRHLHLMWSLLLLGCIWTVCVRLVIIKLKMPVLAIERMLYLSEYPLNMLLTATFSLSVYRNEGFYRRLLLQQKKLQALLFDSPSHAQKLFFQLEHRLLRLLPMIFSFYGICVIVDILWGWMNWLYILHSNMAHNLVGLMISLSLLQYVIALRLISLMYAQLNNRLRQPIPASISIMGEEKGQVEYLRLTWVALNQLHTKFSNKFGVVLMMNFINSLLSFSYELFNIFRLLEQADWSEWVLFLYRCLWILMLGMRVWSVLSANEGILEQVSSWCYHDLTYGFITFSICRNVNFAYV